MSINIIVQSGNMGSDLDTRFTPNGKAISTFSLATKSGYGDNEKTSWVTCKCFGERWQKLAQYIGKGSKVTVSGAFTVEEWEYEGKKHSKVVILVNDIELPANQSKQQSPQQQYQPQQTASQQQYQPQAPSDLPDDSIPF